MVVTAIYFQPITDIRIGRSKWDAIKLLRAFSEAFEAEEILVATTMWNRISTPKQMGEANRRFICLKAEIFSVGGVHCNL